MPPRRASQASEHYFLKGFLKEQLEHFAQLVWVAYDPIDKLRMNEVFCKRIDKTIDGVREWMAANPEVDGSKRCLNNIPDGFEKNQTGLWERIVTASNRAMPGYDHGDRNPEHERYIKILMECLRAIAPVSEKLEGLDELLGIYVLRDYYLTLHDAFLSYLKVCDSPDEDKSAIAQYVESTLARIVAESKKILNLPVDEKLSIIGEYVQWQNSLVKLSLAQPSEFEALKKELPPEKRQEYLRLQIDLLERMIVVQEGIRDVVSDVDPIAREDQLKQLQRAGEVIVTLSARTPGRAKKFERGATVGSFSEMMGGVSTFLGASVPAAASRLGASSSDLLATPAKVGSKKISFDDGEPCFSRCISGQEKEKFLSFFYQGYGALTRIQERDSFSIDQTIRDFRVWLNSLPNKNSDDRLVLENIPAIFSDNQKDFWMAIVETSNVYVEGFENHQPYEIEQNYFNYVLSAIKVHFEQACDAVPGLLRFYIMCQLRHVYTNFVSHLMAYSPGDENDSHVFNLSGLLRGECVDEIRQLIPDSPEHRELLDCVSVLKNICFHIVCSHRVSRLVQVSGETRFFAQGLSSRNPIQEASKASQQSLEAMSKSIEALYDHIMPQSKEPATPGVAVPDNNRRRLQFMHSASPLAKIRRGTSQFSVLSSPLTRVRRLSLGD